jgi:hypothetical protein
MMIRNEKEKKLRELDFDLWQLQGTRRTERLREIYWRKMRIRGDVDGREAYYPAIFAPHQPRPRSSHDAVAA